MMNAQWSELYSLRERVKHLGREMAELFHGEHDQESHGNREGGSGGSSGEARASKSDMARGATVTIGSSPTAFVIRATVEEANLPQIHADGVAVNFQEGALIQTGGVSEAYGVYQPASGEITMASNAYSQQDDSMNVMGSQNIRVLGGAVVLHEIGHHVHLAKLTDESASKWAEISNHGLLARISSYARTNTGEHFAEAYRAYARGGTYRATLKALEPQSYSFMQSLWNKPENFRESGSNRAASSWYEDRYK